MFRIIYAVFDKYKEDEEEAEAMLTEESSKYPPI
jgi:hypothetical protein